MHVRLAGMGRKWIEGGILATALAGLPGWAYGQGMLPPVPHVANPAPATQQVARKEIPPPTYTKNTTFKLPVQIDESQRGNLREVSLYVKTAKGDWLPADRGPANIDSFTYKVPRDGEYWFGLVTTDKFGRSTPPDIAQEPPMLRVVVDSTSPQLEVQAATGADGDFCLRCTVIDANPVPDGIRAVCRTPMGERPLDPLSGQPGTFKIQGAELMSYPVTVTARDRVGNVTTMDVNVKELVAHLLPNGGHTNGPSVKTPEIKETQLPVIVNGPPQEVFSESNRIAPTQTTITLPEPAASPNPSMITLPEPANMGSLPPPSPLPGLGAAVLPTTPDAEPRSPAFAQRQILNTTHASLDYRIDQVGPSGVGKVEIFVTSDNGTTWQRLSENVNRRSPAEIDLPGEGIFGLRIVVTNGNGMGGSPPMRGDQPTCWIEVDTTAPFVQLRPVEPVVNNGALEVRWTATDKKLSAEPISLYYRTRAEGAWQVIGRSLKNDGLYRWNFPRDMGSQFFVKIEVIDAAGNVARAETTNPIILDMTEPRAQVVGITGMNMRTQGPLGN